MFLHDGDTKGNGGGGGEEYIRGENGDTKGNGEGKVF